MILGLWLVDVFNIYVPYLFDINQAFGFSFEFVNVKCQRSMREANIYYQSEKEIKKKCNDVKVISRPTVNKCANKEFLCREKIISVNFIYNLYNL